jgi:molybdopterin synthase catalytic subunit/molybdopterin converting factor small subunit
MCMGFMMRIEVRTFGGLAERAGLTTLIVELPDGADVGALRRTVAAAHPELAPLMPRVAVSVDLELASDTTVLHEGMEIALLPPVAGGAGDPGDTVDATPTITGLVHGPIDVAGTLDHIGAPDVGAVVSFLGTVRDHAPDLDGVVRLEYSAYEPMAERELARIAEEIRAGHPAVRGLALIHALGELDVGAHTILVAVSTAHRDTAFAACRDALEAIKERVPVFKREITADGAHRWVGLPDGVDAPPVP